MEDGRLHKDRQGEHLSCLQGLRVSGSACHPLEVAHHLCVKMGQFGEGRSPTTRSEYWVASRAMRGKNLLAKLSLLASPVNIMKRI